MLDWMIMKGYRKLKEEAQQQEAWWRKTLFDRGWAGSAPE